MSPDAARRGPSAGPPPPPSAARLRPIGVPAALSPTLSSSTCTEPMRPAASRRLGGSCGRARRAGNPRGRGAWRYLSPARRGVQVDPARPVRRWPACGVMPELRRVPHRSEHGTRRGVSPTPYRLRSESRTVRRDREFEIVALQRAARRRTVVQDICMTPAPPQAARQASTAAPVPPRHARCPPRRRPRWTTSSPASRSSTTTPGASWPTYCSTPPRCRWRCSSSARLLEGLLGADAALTVITMAVGFGRPTSRSKARCAASAARGPPPPTSTRARS